MNTDTNELNIILHGCKLNDRAAQEKLYNLYFKRMMLVVRRYIDDYGKAEEVLNNGFLRAFQKIHLFNFQGSFEGWLRRIVFHAVADFVKAEKKHARVILREKDVAEHKDHGDNMYFKQLLHLVEKLPTKTKTVFNLSVFEGLTHKEIGNNLGIDIGTSKWHLSEAKASLRKSIENMQLHLTM